MILAGLDVGTTHCKAGLFAADGALLALAAHPMQARRTPAGGFYYDPDELWETVCEVFRVVVTEAGGEAIASIGIASMAETGLLVDRKSGQPKSAFIPWFDTAASVQAGNLARRSDPFERFCRTGIRPSFKCGLAKLIWLREQGAVLAPSSLWSSVADFVAYRLAGEWATDYSLAGRSYAFRIDRKEWDREWLAEWDLSPDLFPPARLGGTPAGKVTPAAAERTGLPAGTPVAVAGHDHVCAALAAGAILPGLVFDSMGTAETLIGALEERDLAQPEYRSGLSYGCHVIPGRQYWMSGLSASGGSVEWIRSLLGDPPLSYADLEALLDGVDRLPGEILYFPYLTGSGSPHSDPAARGAFVGFKASHTRADLLKAVLEGTAYEVEFARRTAENATGIPIRQVIASGGGTRNRRWLQIKADVSGCLYRVPEITEAACLGAALVAGIGCGMYSNVEDALASLSRPASFEVMPDRKAHAAYRQVYETGFLALQEPLRDYYRTTTQPDILKTS